MQALIRSTSGTARALSLIFFLMICYVAGIALVDENTVRTAAISLTFAPPILPTQVVVCRFLHPHRGHAFLVDETNEGSKDQLTTHGSLRKSQALPYHL